MNLPSQYPLPKDDTVVVAFSGGVDSVAVAHYLIRKLKNVELAFVHHGTDNSEIAYNNTVVKFADEHDCKLHVNYVDTNVPKSASCEEFWRNERYNFFHQFECPVVTAHHLNDCVETWVWACMHGNPRTIPYSNKNVIRPFRLLTKQRFMNYALEYGLYWSDDMSNNDTKYMRNFIRHEMMNNVKVVNPGIEKTVRKLILNQR